MCALRCVCFSLCDAAGADDFAAARPSSVTSPNSPWYSYLTHVYGLDVPLPFDLDDVNFWYHRHSAWPAAIEWPMASCGPRRRQPRCPPDQCARWRSPNLPDATRAIGPARRSHAANGNASRFEVLVIHERRGGTSGSAVITGRIHGRGGDGASSSDEGPLLGGSRGTLLFHRLRPDERFLNYLRGSDRWRVLAPAVANFKANGTARLLGRAAVPSHAWVEVVRQDPSLLRVPGWGARGTLAEGHEGCWLYPAKGSGVFVNVGVTRVDAYKYYRPHEEPRLVRAAAESRLTSIQFLSNSAGTFAEMVLTVPACVRQRSAAPDNTTTDVEALGTCLPPEVELRSGAAHERPCACDDSLGVLNCGTGRPGTAATDDR